MKSSGKASVPNITQRRRRIQDICDRARVVRNGPVDTTFEKGKLPRDIQQTLDILKEAQTFSQSLGPGLQVGKLCQWPQGDGYAYYFVWKIDLHTCQMEWLPGIDNWTSEVVQDGMALRSAVEKAVHSQEAMQKIFGNKPDPFVSNI